MHFLSIDAHRRRRLDTQTNAIPLSGYHDEPDLLANHDLLANAPCEH
jgi:hypothetical protein